MRTNRFVMGAVLGVSLAVAWGRVEAKEKPFHASFAGINTSKDDFSFLGEPEVGYITVAGKSTLGEYTAQGVGYFAPDGKSCTPPEGGSGVELTGVAEVFILSFIATGEQLFLHLSPSALNLACLDTEKSVITGQITFDVNGGTGRFAGATGTIIKTLRNFGLEIPAPPGKGFFTSFTGTFDGTIEIAQ